ncbi:triosephosphate isomerase [Alphaproteobacteria bacterium]|nr:triosephosphate isomerase [Alphaproteobacteria bacterium]
MKIIVANWKMNGNVALVNQFMRELSDIHCNNKIIICPPAALVLAVRAFTPVDPSITLQAYHAHPSEGREAEESVSIFMLGAQDCFYEEAGAFTGEHSPKLLKELGCDYVLLGHSERRALFHESDEIVHKKWKAAIKQSLCPIVCVGEKLEERDNWKDVISKQLESYIDNDDILNTIFAYEPIWSIGTGLVPSIEEIETVLNFIRDQLSATQDAALLYGGSVTSKNAHAILSSDSVDGVLVGGASLKVGEFKAIATAA